MTSSIGNREVVVCHDAAELAGEAARRIVAASKEAIARSGRFTLVLSGGSTPERTYVRLAQPDARLRVDWSRTWIFFGDERCVPLDDNRSNYRLAAKALLETASIDPEQVLSVPTDAGTPPQCAGKYEAELREFFDDEDNESPGSPFPQFDLILLGLGSDGHTASLFPGMPSLKETKAWVISSPPGVLPPPVDRVTFTFPLLNAARQVMFLVSGAEKVEATREILEGNPPVEKRPAAGVRPANGKLVWLVDQAAMNDLNPAMIGATMLGILPHF